MNFSANIKLMRQRKRVSQEEAAQQLGVKRTSLTGYEKGTSYPSYMVLVKISNYYNISLDILLKEDLTSFSEYKLSELDRSGIDVQGKYLRVLTSTVGTDNEENIELVPHKAKAGYTAGYQDPEYINELATFRIPFLDQQKKYRTFQISGDSMPPVADGAWVTGEFVQNWQEVKNGYPYIVVTKDDGIVFKILYNKLKENGSFLLCSTNMLYQPYEVEIENIIEVWSFTHFLSSDLPVYRIKK